MATSARTRTTRRHGVVLAAALLLVVAGSTACEPRLPARDRPVILVHGWSAFGAGIDCRNAFGTLTSRLQGQQFTGQMVTVAFYDSDRNCTMSLRDWADISNSTSWKNLSKAFSWFVYRTYTVNGITVDLVGHSMGGLITRGAVYGSKKGEAGFAPPLLVEDSVTLAAPHNGAAWYSAFCLWGQCSGLKPGATDLAWLDGDGDPQGAQGTEWTVFGSDSDDVVPVDSALHMSVPDARKVRYANLEHSDYQQDATSTARIATALAEAGS